MEPGPTPVPAAAPPTVVFDEVTNGYVPRSMSSIAPCAPSNRMLSPRACMPRSTSVTSTTSGFHAFAEPQEVLELAAQLDALVR